MISCSWATMNPPLMQSALHLRRATRLQGCLQKATVTIRTVAIGMYRRSTDAVLS